MAGYTPPFRDGKHAPMAGTPGFCYSDNMLCGGEDVLGHPIICACCITAGLAAPPVPPPESPAGGGPEQHGQEGNGEAVTEQPQAPEHPGAQSVQEQGQQGAVDSDQEPAEMPASGEPGAQSVQEQGQTGQADPAWPDRSPEVPFA